MAKYKFYAVRKGNVPGIYGNWDDCRAQVTGYPNAEFKGFKEKSDAEAYMRGEAPAAAAGTELLYPYAFVDGSYNDRTKTCGYGGFVVREDGTRYTLQGSDTDPGWAAMHNVSGEIVGCMAAVAKAIELGLSELHIYYDYTGIELFADGTWEPAKPGTIAYKRAMDMAAKKLRISFHKVKAHTGIPGNELADKLAKQAVGIG